MCRSVSFYCNPYYIAAILVAAVVASEGLEPSSKKLKMIEQANIQSDGALQIMRQHGGRTVPEVMASVLLQQVTDATTTAQKQMEEITETVANSFAEEKLAAEDAAQKATEVSASITQKTNEQMLDLKPSLEHFSPEQDDMLKLAKNLELYTKLLFDAAADMRNHVESTKSHFVDILNTSRGLTKRATDSIQLVSEDIHKHTDEDISRISTFDSEGNGGSNSIKLIKSQMQILDDAMEKNVQQVVAVGGQTEKDITAIASTSSSVGDELVSRMDRDAQRRKEALQDATAALGKESADAITNAWSVSPSEVVSDQATSSSRMVMSPMMLGVTAVILVVATAVRFFFEMRKTHLRA